MFKGEDLQPSGRGFKSRHRILAKLAITLKKRERKKDSQIGHTKKYHYF